MVMGIGALCSVFPLIAGYFYAKYIGKKVTADDEANCNDVKKSYEELVAEYGKLPNGFIALAPILMSCQLRRFDRILSGNHRIRKRNLFQNGSRLGDGLSGDPHPVASLDGQKALADLILKGIQGMPGKNPQDLPDQRRICQDRR